MDINTFLEGCQTPDINWRQFFRQPEMIEKASLDYENILRKILKDMLKNTHDVAMVTLDEEVKQGL